MTEQPPEILAQASLSPLSPAPIPLHTSSSDLVPRLQDHAAAFDLSTPGPATPALAHLAAVAMTAQDQTEISDTIVVGGDYSDDSAMESDDSFDAYGEDEEGQEHENEPDSVNDDYANTFESPASQDKSEVDEAQPDVSKASESMISSPEPDTLKSHTPPPAPPSALSSPPPPSRQSDPSTSDQDHNAPAEPASDSEDDSEFPSSASNASPSSAPGSPISAAAAATVQTAVAAAVATLAPPPAGKDNADVDIQKLVDNITARAAAPVAAPLPPAPAPAPAPAPVSATPVTAATSQNATSSLPLSHSASLPPKPSVSHQAPSHLPAIPQTHSFQSRNPNALVSPAALLPPAGPAAQRGQYPAAGAPGTTVEGISSLPPPPPSSFNPSHVQHNASPAAPPRHMSPMSASVHHAWETFLADEKRYTSEAKWERFPEGSRIFIGNLSSERVTKREVFDMFQRFGRLAQISLKNAYGFVQYHTISEGQTAMQNAQGVELGGRKIHLEISRKQKKKDKEERDRSPEPRGLRGVRGAERLPDRVPDRAPDRYDAGWRRDDYRPGRSPSPPRRSDTRGSRDGFFPRDRGAGGAFDRRRSRSPARGNRLDADSYRRRSPSPHRRTSSDGALDMPRRYGNDVPDVQLVLLQEVSREFIAWVQRAFHDKGLKTDVMHLNPRFPRNALMERQVLEGVHAIIDLDFASQMHSKLSIQIFIRSGNDKVDFELYQNVDPPVAAALVLREKNKVPPSRPAYPPASYNNSYLPDAPPPAAYPYQYPQVSAPAPAPPAHHTAQHTTQTNNILDLDNSALQALLSSLQGPQAPALHQQGMAPQAAQVDINAILGSIRNAAAGQQPVMPGYGGMGGYAQAPAYPAHGAGPISPTSGAGMMGYGADTAQQVQTIMEQLKRAAQ